MSETGRVVEFITCIYVVLLALMYIVCIHNYYTITGINEFTCGTEGTEKSITSCDAVNACFGGDAGIPYGYGARLDIYLILHRSPAAFFAAQVNRVSLLFGAHASEAWYDSWRRHKYVNKPPYFIKVSCYRFSL